MEWERLHFLEGRPGILSVLFDRGPRRLAHELGSDTPCTVLTVELPFFLSNGEDYF